eukprot:m.66915 g.66915  ORF g.66915 m.66915 type:complete len:369 (-) comp15956_c0_seq2:53-1159(-)
MSTPQSAGPQGQSQPLQHGRNIAILIYSAVRQMQALFPFNWHRIISGAIGQPWQLLRNIALDNGNEFYWTNWVSLLANLYPTSPGHRIVYFERAQTEKFTDDAGTCIVYLNGILTNKPLVALNQQRLDELFVPPVHYIHNATNGVLEDLLESYQDLQALGVTKVTDGVVNILHANVLSLPNVRKVLLIAHSQGTIITAAALPALYDKCSEDEHKKLEVYSFATCCHRMEYTVPATDQQGGLPYMEHFANTGDFVACLGILATPSTRLQLDMRYDGPVFTRQTFGHFLNAHYLDALGAYEHAATTATLRPNLFTYLRHPPQQPTEPVPVGKLEKFIETIAAIPTAVVMVPAATGLMLTKLALDLFCTRP